MNIDDVCKKAYEEYFSDPRWLARRAQEQTEYIQAYKLKAYYQEDVIRPDWREVLQSAHERLRYLRIIYNATNFNR